MSNDADSIASLRNFASWLPTYLQAPQLAAQHAVLAALYSDLSTLLARIDHANPNWRSKQIQLLESNLLKYLPRTLERLQLALQATPVRVADLPLHLVLRWRSPDDVYRIEIQPTEDLGENASLRRFVTATSVIAPTITGAPVFNLAAGNAITDAFQQAFSAALLIIAFLLLFIFRNAQLVLLTMIPLLIGALITAGILVIADLGFNYANIIGLPLLLGIGVDNGIHMVSQIHNYRSNRNNLLHSSTARAIFYSTLVTMVSFGNFMLSSHPGTSSLGVVLTLGVGVMLITNFVVLPALYAVGLGKQE